MEGKDCIIQITVNAQQDYLAQDKKDVMYIGEDLFENYYVVLDYDNQKIGLAGFTEVVPEKPASFPLWAIILIAVAGVFIIGLGVWFFIKKRQQREFNNGIKNYSQLEN